MKRWKLIIYSLIVSIMCIWNHGISQTTVDISPSKDNTLYEYTSVALSNGAGQHFFAGNNSANADVNTRRAVIQFDIVGNIPAGAFITNVELKLNLSSTGSGSQTVSLYKLLEDWGEGSSDAAGGELDGAPATTGDATWQHTFFSSSLWEDIGGTHEEYSSASLVVGGLGDYQWSSGQMIADVQNWVLDPSSNFGWLIRGNETQSDRFKGFDTKEHPTAENRPVLSVTYISTSAEAIPATKDNTLYESDTGGISNGSGEFMFVGIPLIGNVRRRAVLQFDLNGYVPSSATIEGVILSLNMSKSQADNEDIHLHKLTTDWGEGSSDAPNNEGAGTNSQPGDATWQHRFYNNMNWTTPGGDFVAASSGSQNIGDERIYNWGSTSGMVSDVQEWVDNPSNNFGWILIGNESTFLTTKRFNTRENVTSPPALYVFYTNTLPVELSNFEANRIGRNVQLTWETHAEIDNLGFDVEHSKDGSRFSSIGFVKGAGQSSKIIKYEFFDKNPLTGPNYYRLKQADTNGKFEYSTIVKAVIPAQNTLNGLLVYPNPGSDQISVQQLENVPSIIKIFDSAGKLMLEVQLSQDERSAKTIQISDWPNGKYFIRGSHGEQTDFIKIR